MQQAAKPQAKKSRKVYSLEYSEDFSGPRTTQMAVDRSFATVEKVNVRQAPKVCYTAPLMGLYCKHVFPRLMDYVMRGEEFRQLRTGVLQSVAGEVLEIGIGTGLNLAHYGLSVSRVRAVDPTPMLPTRMAGRRAAVHFTVEISQQSAERLPYEDRTFDCVVSTWTLCTITDPIRALHEVRRVLRPGGRFLFLEHGRSDDQKTARWQDRLNPVQNIIGCGCNLNRRIDDLIAQAGLTITQLDRFAMQGVPRVGGEMYRGTAVGQG